VNKSEPNLGDTDHDDESLPLSTRDVELEPVSLRDIEMILAPGKSPPPLERKAAPKAPPPAAVRARQSPAKPDAAAALPRPRKVASQPPKVAAKPTARKDDSATVDLEALLGGAARSIDTTPTSNLDVVISPTERRPKPVPKAPPKSRASAPDDGPTALDAQTVSGPTATVDTREWATGSEPPPPVESPKPAEVAAEPAKVTAEPAKPTKGLDAGPQALEAFVMDEEPMAPVEMAERAPDPGASTDARESADAPEPVAPKKARVAPKPPRKERRDSPVAPDVESGPRSSRKPESSKAESGKAESVRPRAAAKTLEPAPRKSLGAPPEEKRSSLGVYLGVGAAAAGLLIYFATSTRETPQAAPSSVAATPTPTATQGTMPGQPSGASAVEEPAASVATPEPSTSPEPTPSAAPSLTGKLPVGAAEPATAGPAAAQVPTTPATPKPTAAPASGGGDFDRSAAAAALGGATGQAAGCKAAGDPSGVAKVSVTFAPSGRVTQALVMGPPFAGTATGGCIARAFRSASVPPFAGEAQTVTKTVNIP
jgi:hypothetical protein